MNAKEYTLKHLLRDVASLMVSIACSYMAASAVLAVIGGITGYLIAYCAALGAAIMYAEVAGRVAQGALYLTHRVERAIARRRNDRMFYTLDC